MKFLKNLGLIALAMLVVTAPLSVASPASAADHWGGAHIAVSVSGSSGWGYGEGNNEDEARANAIFQCEVANGNGNCTRGTSVPSNWYLVAASCDGTAFTGASEHGYDQAVANTFNKAHNIGYWNCYVVEWW